MALNKAAGTGIEADVLRNNDQEVDSTGDSDDAVDSLLSFESRPTDKDKQISLSPGLNNSSQQPLEFTENSLPDLGHFQGTDLRKVDLAELRAVEANGNLYAEHFRRLQLHPTAYNNFFHEIVQHVRHRYSDHLKRGTLSSLRTLSVVLLRGFGYIVWTQHSQWLIAESDLDSYEERLVYDRKKNFQGNEKYTALHAKPTQFTKDSRFFAILENFWRMLRNATFEPKNAEERTQLGRVYTLAQSRTKRTSFRNTASAIPVLPSGTEILNRGQSESDCLFLERQDLRKQNGDQVQSESWCDISVPREIMKYMTMIMVPFAYMSGQDVSEQPGWSETKAMQLWDEIMRAHDLAAEITTPSLYKALWAKFAGCEHPMHVLMGIDLKTDPDGARFAENTSPEDQVAAIVAHNKALLRNSLMDMIANLNLSNEPWISHQNPVGRPKVSESGVQPPERMNVWISASKALNYGDPTSLAKSPRPWAQPDAPVGPHDMNEFLGGLDQRAQIPGDCVAYCYVLSYGWNDSMTVIENDNPDLNMGNGTPCREKRKAGWQIFQKDLQAAAEEGVNIFRLKALVFYGEAGDAE